MSDTNKDAILPVLAGSEDGIMQVRRQSTLAVSGVLQYIEQHRPELLSSEGHARHGCIESFVNELDRDGDGRISDKELYLALRDFYNDAIRANEEALRASSKIRKYKLAIGGLIIVMILLVGTVFGTSFAAARLAKDTQVSERALLTKDSQPVGINLNEIFVPVAALAVLPYSVTSKIHELVLNDDDGKTYHRIKEAIDIAPGQSVTLHTTHGDIISWENTEENRRDTRIELANGQAWNTSALCGECTATSVVADDSIVTSLDGFYASLCDFYTNDSNDGDRRLKINKCGGKCASTSKWEKAESKN